MLGSITLIISILESVVMKKNLVKFLVFFVLISGFYERVYAKSEVNVYSYRQPILINPFFEEFTKLTGIEVNVLHAKKRFTRKSAC